jgi:hypothetical protein
MLCSLAALLLCLALYGTQQSFAQPADNPAGLDATRAFQRGIAESISITSAFGSPAAPNHYVRGMSERLSVTSAFPGQAQQAGAPAGPSLRGAQYTPGANQRIDEKSHLTFKNLKRDTAGTLGGTPYHTFEAPVLLASGSQGSSDTSDGSGEGSEPDDNSTLLRRMELIKEYALAQQSTGNAAILLGATSGSFAVVLLGAAARNATAGTRRMTATSAIAAFALGLAALNTDRSYAEEYDPDKPVIEIVSAYHLNSDRLLVGDISEELGKLDGVWSSEVSDGQYVRLVFEQELTLSRDITIYPRVVSGEPTIQVYEAEGDSPIAEFAPVNSYHYNKVYLTNLDGSQDTFDLRVSGGSVEFDHIIDPRTVPTYVGDGGQASGAGAISPALPGSLRANDILLLFVETANQASSIATQGDLTWTEVTNSPQGANGGSLATSTRLTVFWARYDGVATVGPTTNDSGNHQIGVIMAFRGVVTSGNPWDITSGGTETTSDTSGSIPTATTTVDNTLVVLAIATSVPDADGTAAFSSWTNANLANLTERFDVSRAINNGGALGIATGEKATAGATGTTAVTVSTSATKGMMTIALKAPNIETGTPSQTVTVADSVAKAFVTNRAISDSLAVSDSIARVTIFNRLASESIPVTDSISIRPAPHVPDTIAVSDSVTAAPNYHRSASDSVPVSDDIARTITVSEAASDSVPILDAIATSVTRSVDDPLSVADSPAAFVARSRSAADTLTATDDIAMRVSRSIADTLAVADSAARTLAASRSISDTLAVADSAARSAVFARSAADSLSVSDEVATDIVYARAAADSFTVADSAASDLAASRSATDSLSITDDATWAFGASVSDAIGVADNVTTQKSFARSVSETLSTADSATRAFATSRSPSDSVSVADAIARSVSRSVADTLLVTDEIATQKSFARPIADSLSAADSPDTDVGTARSIADAVSAADSIATDLVALRQPSDTITVADEVVVEKSIGRPISDTLAVADSAARTLAASRSISDTLAVADSAARSAVFERSAADVILVEEEVVGAKSFERATSDSLSVTDSVAIAYHAARSPTDTLAITDAITRSINVAIQLSETLPVADNAARIAGFARSAADSVLVDDTSIEVEKSFGRSVSDAVSVSDGVAGQYGAPRSASDDLALADGVARSLAGSRSASETVAMGDEVTAVKSFAGSAAETVSVSDVAAPAYAASRSASDAVAVTESVAVSLVASRSASDAVSFEDEVVAVKHFAVSTSDALEVSESVVAVYLPVRVLSDTLAIGDSILQQPGETIVISDTVSIGLFRSVADSLTIEDAILSGMFDTLTVTDAITSISVHWNRSFEEELGLGECTPLACNPSPSYTENLQLSDSVTLEGPPELEDSLTVADGVSAAVSYSVTVSDTVTAAASAGFAIKFAPPAAPEGVPELGAVLASGSDAVEPMAAEAITGTYTMTSGDPEELAAQLDIPTIDITGGVSDLSGMTLVMPLYLVSLESSDEFPADEVIMTVKAEEVPAGVPMLITINIADTPETADAELLWITIEYTPGVEATDFALIVAPMTEPPAGAPATKGDVVALYMDFSWIGTFDGDVDLSDPSYYDTAPTFTFAISEDWADENNVDRDENGVPIIALNLLDEDTGTWTVIDDVTAPTEATDGQYIYEAQLEHFSTYAVSADEAPAASGGGGIERFAVNLADALGLNESSAGRVIGVVEEFVGEQFAANLLDSVTISIRPVAYKTLQVGESVQVGISLQDVVQDTAVPPAAKALFLIDIENAGETPESFTLEFWYNDSTGRRAYETSRLVEIGPMESRQETLEIPFASPGTFEVTAGAVSASGMLLSVTQLTVAVPWLAVYMYLLIIAAAVILAGSAGAGWFFMRKRIEVIFAAKGMQKVGPAMPEPGTEFIRATPALLDLDISATLVNATAGVLPGGISTAIVELEVANMGAVRLEFTLRHWTEDPEGRIRNESSQTVALGAGESARRRVAMALGPPGTYTLNIDALGAEDRILGKARVKATVM